ncbi:NADH dehydrogenase [ubiquinone] 1 beta subcomplex subunit 11, mitochondrial-like [Cydia amplana]|uniref:NADH dehydrogenase [ubiquinone] 1 beta subcomplex subunit 11, mitochondrial-like n=1 Tax=Cydia amplana TaxID=1869771 RepID=UPI002FE6104F
MHRFWNRTNYRSVTACKPREPPCPPPEAKKQISQNWVSYGFDYENCQDDYNYHHASYFFTITLCIIFGGFAWVYAPDVCLRDWAQREAFLELRRREAGGMPAIDPNYVPSGQIKLPSEQQICDMDIEIVI